jgi:hypothetical protein
MKRELILVLIVGFALQACLSRNVILTESPATNPPVDIPTWTPRPGETLAASPTATKLPTPTSTATALLPITTTPAQIIVKVEGGNLNIRRGPSVYYDMISVLKDGDTIPATARDRKGDWVYLELPGSPGKYGWISLLTEYTTISGHVDGLPYKEADPAIAAYIRNCTSHTMWVMPAYIELAKESASPYNEDRFWPGIFYIYDMNVNQNKPFMDITVREGSQIDIIKDGNGTKSKCE